MDAYRAIALLTPPQIARVEGIPQTVAQKIKSQGSEHNQNCR
jgi:hypothetical protein